MLTVWRWSEASYYFRHPLIWFKDLYYNMHYAHDRMTKGYCYLDKINFEVWFKEIASNMLRDLAMYSHGYPGTPPFETPEKWSSWLHRMADQLAKCVNEDEGNEYYEKYMDLLENFSLDMPESKELKEARENYHRRWDEINKEHKKLFKETMDELIEHWDCLWD